MRKKTAYVGLGRLALILFGWALIVLALMETMGQSKLLFYASTYFPEQVSFLFSPLIVGGIGLISLFIGGLLPFLAPCACCMLCYMSGIPNPDVYLNPIREFRDKVLKDSLIGKIGIWFYYHLISPLFILFILLLPFKWMKREIGLFLISKIRDFSVKMTKLYENNKVYKQKKEVRVMDEKGIFGISILLILLLGVMFLFMWSMMDVFSKVLLVIVVLGILFILALRGGTKNIVGIAPALGGTGLLVANEISPLTVEGVPQEVVVFSVAVVAFILVSIGIVLLSRPVKIRRR